MGNLEWQVLLKSINLGTNPNLENENDEAIAEPYFVNHFRRNPFFIIGKPFLLVKTDFWKW